MFEIIIDSILFCLLLQVPLVTQSERAVGCKAMSQHGGGREKIEQQVRQIMSSHRFRLRLVQTLDDGKTSEMRLLIY